MTSSLILCATWVVEANTLVNCKLPSKVDPVVGYSNLYGRPTPNDTVWHNQEWAFRMHGPLSRFTLFKAWFYDGEWHDPGELKGLQSWYGHGAEQYTHADRLLVGAKRPHVPKNFTLYRDEVLVRAELEWDNIMRWANLPAPCKGRWFAWGFPDVAGATRAVVQAPPGTYVAAFRGFEGKPLPKHLGGYKKRYIAQLGFVWARRDCGGAGTVVTESQAVTGARRKSSSQQPDTQPRPAKPATAPKAAP
ncbi:hypothetical protein COO60DRAFT_1528060 [Scenedesmus sp. NREL 46B-D3]|nr:hypothetical protein COO60DRAFT_1528060 [Scenedesmus sp. NREL 46B-D3]